MKSGLIACLFFILSCNLYSQTVRLLVNQYGSSYYTADVIIGNDIFDIEMDGYIEFENIDSVSMFWQYDNTVDVEIFKPGSVVSVDGEKRLIDNWLLKMETHLITPKIVGRILVHYNNLEIPDLSYYTYVLYKSEEETDFNYSEPGDVTYDLPLSYRQWIDDFCYKGFVTDGDQETDFVLSNWPNPFFKETKIKYLLPKEGRVSIHLYDNQGRLVDVLIDNQTKASGYITYSPKSEMKTGEYVCSLLVNDRTVVNRKVFLIK